MSLGGIIAKLLGKSKTQSGAPAGWGGWLDTAEGKQWEAVGEFVYSGLEEAKVNVHARRIILGNSATLTIDQVAQRIAEKTGQDIEVVREHVMLRLEEAADSDDEERDDEVDMGAAIERWLDDVRKSVRQSR
jgi:hypothetical protein